MLSSSVTWGAQYISYNGWAPTPTQWSHNENPLGKRPGVGVPPSMLAEGLVRREGLERRVGWNGKESKWLDLVFRLPCGSDIL